ncbi:DMT family transporter [Amycolatopsis minnesotensis]|uniref:DMT family transporter n=1 Tax=Amycolatopsis minnesotensis TaxID=337894 RepID=UPI0031D4B3F0
MGAVVPAGFVLMWSSGFVGAALGARSGGVLTLLMWRFLVAALLVLAWFVLKKRRLGAKDVAVHAGIGLLSQCVYLLGVTLAIESGVPTGTAALIAALQPVVAAALGGIVLGERTTRAQWLGLAIGLGGVALVVSGDLTGGDAPAVAFALPVLGMLGLVAATFVERRVKTAVPLGDALVVQCVTSAVLFSGIAFATGTAAPPPDGSFWFAVAWVVVLSTFGGYGFYWLSIARGSVTKTSSLLYLTPPTTMIAGYLLFGERPTTLSLLGLAVCAIAVALVHTRKREVVPARSAGFCRCPGS